MNITQQTLKADELQQAERAQQQAAYERFTEQTKHQSAPPNAVANPMAYESEADSRRAVRRGLLEQREDWLGIERILGANDLLPINYLAAGLKVGRAVCRIQIRDVAGRVLGHGTGFLVSPQLLLTNHHVLPGAAFAQRSLAEFDYEDDVDFIPKDSKLFSLQPKKFFYNSAALDFALVAVNPHASSGAALSDFGFLPLIGASGKALIGEPVSIIQHPSGASKQIAVRNNHILNLVAEFIHYETDTQRGSSGSPVFNDQWQVAALHHASVPRKDAQGRILAKNGQPWTPNQGDDQIDWIANEGVRISAIVQHLRARNWQAGHKALLGKLLDDHIEVETNGFLPDSPTGLTNGDGPMEAEPTPITTAEFYALASDTETTEAQLAPYLMLDEKHADAFAPAFKLNPETVVDAAQIEGDQALGWLNGWARSHRHRQYRRKLRRVPNALRIVSEGDSWFQFPLLLHDIIDCIAEEPDIAVFSLGKAGDWLRNMMAEAEYVDAIEREEADVFLFSAGGNDAVGGRRLSTLLHPFAPERLADDYFNDAFRDYERELRTHYEQLFSTLTARFPQLHIFCHGYDYVRPGNGRWLGGPMRDNGISDVALQRNIVRLLIDRTNEAIAERASQYANVHYLDLRGQVGDHRWFDELHPNDESFRDVANLFISAMRANAGFR